MFDFGTLFTALGALREFLPLVKDREMRISLQQKILEMQSLISDARDQNRQLQDEIEKLRFRLDTRELPKDVPFKANHYLAQDGTPLCMRCLNEDRKQRQLVRSGETDAHCPSCKSRFMGVFPREPQPFERFVQAQAETEARPHPKFKRMI